MLRRLIIVPLVFGLLCGAALGEDGPKADQEQAKSGHDKVSETFRKAIKDQDWEAAEKIIQLHQKSHPDLATNWIRQEWKVALHLARKKEADGQPLTYLKTYPMGDLPVAMLDSSTIDVRVVFGYLLAKVGEPQWNDAGTSLIPYDQGRSLIVSTTPEVHKKIADALAELRD